MPYSVTSRKTGAEYYLHRRVTATPGGERVLYFFSKQVKEGAIDQPPEGYEVIESSATGLPLLKRK
ncbi:MAG: hypothetical protein FJX72_05975 [Armatimonadetes bacterium]|nr:hypothetical protein [Armatimonadota bacterium]